MITWYNHPYYVTHFEKHGFTAEKEWIESQFPFSNIKPEYFTKANTLIKKRYQVKALKVEPEYISPTLLHLQNLEAAALPLR